MNTFTGRMLGMMKSITTLAVVLGVGSVSFAVPSLQVGSPAGAGDSGSYADYHDTLTNPSEEDTALVNGGTLLVAGAYKNNPELLIGGQYTGVEGTGEDWTDFGFDNAFAGAGAILMAVVPNGTLGDGTLQINGQNPIYTTSIFEDGFVMPAPPANHAPVPNQDYLFFDIGNFDISWGNVGDFYDDNGTAPASGEIKTLVVTATGYQWIHFDVFALVTSKNGPNMSTSLKGNPGSHDTTHYGEPQPQPQPQPQPDIGEEPPTGAPEPTTAMFGMMTLGALLLRRRR